MTSGRVATLTDRIVEKLKIQARALDDDEFAAYLGVIRQAVNQACRRLKREGIVERFVGPNNKIVNRLRSSEARKGRRATSSLRSAPTPRARTPLGG
jgi:DNA-binding GntR family transcriptional regulator